MSRNYIVTGCAGFIGSTLVDRLLAKKTVRGALEKQRTEGIEISCVDTL